MTASHQSYGGYGGYGSNKGQTNQMSYGTPQISYPKSSSNYAGSAPKLPVYPGLEQPANSSPLVTLMKAIATTSTTTSTTKKPAQVQLDLNAQKYPDSSTGSDFQDQMMQYMQAMEQYMQLYNPQMFEQQKHTNQASNAMALSKPSSSGGQYGISQRVGAASGPTNIQQIRAQAKKMQQRNRPTRPPTTEKIIDKNSAGFLWCAGERQYEKKEKPKKKAPKKKIDSSGRVILSKFAKTAAKKPAGKKPWAAPRPNLGIKKSPVQMKSTGGIFEKGGPIPAGIKTIPIVSNQKTDMCRNQGGWGEPCSFDMTVGDACDEKQFWSDNGYSRFIVKCVRSKKRPGHSVRLKMVMTCEWGNCRNGGGSG
ncbi:unnamed protein product [Oikopleura dioica]|uniref:Uncharacterized protein n=1 Tax=Oikopleura dioica TaxID=34765 RepID=E4Y9F2_OIKDI|nr:unnamed protein product [Oikopleura dioica]